MNVLDPALLNRCIHCGICLATCPTYDLTQHERHSPRGRLNLMKSVLHGEIKPTRAFAEEMYDCLGCLACETSCPAGIEYGQLLETSRSLSEEHGSLDSPLRCLLRRIFLREVFTRPRLLRFLGRLVRVAQLLRLPDLLTASGIPLLLPASFRAALQLSPPISPLFSDRLIRPLEKPARTTRRVALLTGCVQDLIYAEINRDTADLLLAAGCEVVTPPVQPCCGSLHAHQGDLTTSRELARRLIRLFPPADFDAIISNAGGCGSHLRQFSHLLALDPEFSDSAILWDSKIRDIHEFLFEISWSPPSSLTSMKKIRGTIHESCHLYHGQKIRTAPQELLRQLPDYEWSVLPESTWCCGSAGIYNLTHPATAEALLRRKINHLRTSGASIVATANPGCLLQLQTGARKQGLQVECVHPVTLLARACRSASSSSFSAHETIAS